MPSTHALKESVIARGAWRKTRFVTWRALVELSPIWLGKKALLTSCVVRSQRRYGRRLLCFSMVAPGLKPFFWRFCRKAGPSSPPSTSAISTRRSSRANFPGTPTGSRWRICFAVRSRTDCSIGPARFAWRRKGLRDVPRHASSLTDALLCALLGAFQACFQNDVCTPEQWDSYPRSCECSGRKECFVVNGIPDLHHRRTPRGVSGGALALASA